MAGLLTATCAFAQIEVGTIGTEPVLKVFPSGVIKPAGRIRCEMRKDMEGFVGHLDELVPSLTEDPIYGSGRLHKDSKLKDLGNHKGGDAEGDEQYKWWNSETQSNWWDGYIRNAFLLGDTAAIERCRQRVEYILSTQDADGYIGICDNDLRYKGKNENGELWSKATLYRGLIAYYEFTGDKRVWDALVRAVDNVMANWPAGKSAPFDTGTGYNGGVGHGLVFTDVLDRMYQLAGDKRYEDYALFLYLDYSKWPAWEQDAQLKNVLDAGYRLKCHGVHTYEHLRPIAVAAGNSDNPELLKALNVYLQKVQRATTVTGGPIGDEWIGGRQADATGTGYEFCSIHELLDSYGVLLRRTGDPRFAELIETIYYNAAMGAKHPDYSSIAYLKTDNSFSMDGTRNGDNEAGHKQTRYKYSPVHQDVAVCCVPNAGRITPYFLQNAWMTDSDGALVANVLMPSVLDAEIGGKKVGISVTTSYPDSNTLRFRVSAGGERQRLKIRIPSWASGVACSVAHEVADGYVVVERSFADGEEFTVSFDTDVRIVESAGGRYIAYGAQFYALPIDAVERKGREYAPGFADYYYEPAAQPAVYKYSGGRVQYSGGGISACLTNTATGQEETVRLIPMGGTILRQTAF